MTRRFRPGTQRASAEAAAAAKSGDHATATRQHELAASYRALHEAYRERETVFATIMTDRADWDAATRAQRHLAVAADVELRRRHPGQHYLPLRSAEPQPATETQRAELTLIPGEPPGEMGHGHEPRRRRSHRVRGHAFVSTPLRPDTLAVTPSLATGRPFTVTVEQIRTAEPSLASFAVRILASV